MPIYEYQCSKCNHKHEALQRLSDEPLRQCPECGRQSLRKLVSAASFRLKGVGWYETDFKDKKDQKKLSKPDEKSRNDSDAKKSDAPDSKKPTSSSKTSTPAKPASTTSANGD